MLAFEDLLLPGVLLALAVVSTRLAFSTYARYHEAALDREAARLERLPGRRR